MGKKEPRKTVNRGCKEETAVVVCPYSTAAISVSAWPGAQPALTQVSLIFASTAAVAEQNGDSRAKQRKMAKPGGKYPKRDITAGQISLQANCFLRLVLSQSNSLSHSRAAQSPLTPVAKRRQAQAFEQQHKAGMPWASCEVLVDNMAHLVWVLWKWYPTAWIKINMGRSVQVLWILGQHSLTPVTRCREKLSLLYAATVRRCLEYQGSNSGN